MEELMDKNKSQDTYDWKIALIIFIIIKCLILTVNSEASDFTTNKYIPGYDCDETMPINCGNKYYQTEEWKKFVSYNCDNYPEYKFINSYNLPLYRCGDLSNNHGQFI
tara:strand:+ start:64 stop:387 length:324 start_codon:yes stop_codon:yes gene_type:complete